MIQEERIRQLNNLWPGLENQCVFYWMQQSQRESCNHALEFSINLANKYEKPLAVIFILTHFPEANKRHYYFMLEGLVETKRQLEKRGIQFMLQTGNPVNIVVNLSKKAVAMIFDKGYLRIQKEWRQNISKECQCQLFEIESDVIIPVNSVSLKEEYNARTIRGKINRLLPEFVVPLKKQTLRNKNKISGIKSEEFDDIDTLLKKLTLDTSVEKAGWIKGGIKTAKRFLDSFISKKIDYFHTLRNDPSNDYQSHLSPFLHFGQISSLYIVEKIKKIESPGKAAFLEELIIRRELSINFVDKNPEYDTFHCLPEWAVKTLLAHKKDKRTYLYNRDDLEYSQTHDRYWNAAQYELVKTGMMHGYLRMYWGKKILEWSKTPEQAFKNALYLNNKYSLDGRDPNSFTGVAWCFGKHDRAWKERPVFGKVRYMNDKGLERKFNMTGYVNKIKEL
jgi:deoxyribodipyrimidine photo-lyase